jgi:hypothetical protein
MALPASDNFNRANEYPIGGNWSAPSGGDGLYLDNYVVVPNGSTTYISYWNADAFNNNQYSQCIIPSDFVGYGHGGPAVRVQSGAITFYVLDYGEVSDTFRIYKCVANSFTKVGADISHTFSNSEVYKLSAEGTDSVTLSFFVDGNLEATRTDSSSTITDGSAGIYGNGGFQSYDNWEGGDLAAGGLSILQLAQSLGGNCNVMTG